MDQLERNARMLRQLDIANPAKLAEQNVTIIGAGGIGSFVGVFLAKMGVQKFTLYDDDMVEDHNLPNQLYPDSALGKSKVEALADEMRRFDPSVKVEAKKERVTADTKLEGIVIGAVDSMPARKEIWKAVKQNLSVPAFLDSRMGAEIGQVREVNPIDKAEIEQYEKSLEGVPVDLPCTARAILYNGAMIASLIANAVKRIAMEEKNRPVEVVFSYPDLEIGEGLFVTQRQK